MVWMFLIKRASTTTAKRIMSKTQFKFTVDTDQALFLRSLKRHRVPVNQFVRYVLAIAEREIDANQGGYWGWFAEKERERKEYE